MRKHNTAGVDKRHNVWYNVAMKNHPNKQCNNCNQTYTPGGPSQKYCSPCGKEKKRKNAIEVNKRARMKQGRPVGVGSGNNQGSGKTHATYKNGTGIYKKLGKQKAIELGHCERCNSKLDLENPFKWCTHHKDHNRMNNELQNLEILCKACHQKEHKVHLNFNKGIVEAPSNSGNN